jgi:hypothetical protein
VCRCRPRRPNRFPQRTIRLTDLTSNQNHLPVRTRNRRLRNLSPAGSCDRYVLKAAGNTTYELDQQTGIPQHENKNVHIVGILDAASNTIHIVRIEPTS